MSKTIDERVVEMRFDTKQFMREAKSTITVLDRLKSALNFGKSATALKDINESVKTTNLDKMAASLEFLEKRFSTLGIVGMTVIQNITTALTGSFAKAVNYATDAIVSGGIKRAMNIENAHFQLQALLKDEAKVQAVMADAMESVDGTAYAYDEAAKAASQFAASGIQAGEDMLNALKGITGVAAMTNSDFESISRIFTTVAGNGRLMGDQLLQLSSRGMNAASTIADYFREVQGQSKITEADIREMCSKGAISFEDFANAMTWAFGDSAKRANETFNGAMSNMKSALARIGAGFISPLVEQNGEMVKLFNALRVQINNVKSALVFDEQKSALSGLSKSVELSSEALADMAKRGTIGFDYFTNSILSAKDSEGDFTEQNEKLLKIFEEVNKDGKITADTLDDFYKNGISAARLLKTYINDVKAGKITASSDMKIAIRELSSDVAVTTEQIYDWARSGKISAELFSTAMVQAAGNLEKGGKVANEALSALFTKVKKDGSLSVEVIRDLSKNGINAGDALNKYLMGVQRGTIRATYATKQAIGELFDETGHLKDGITKMAEEGKISFDIFQSAMEEAYGDSMALSKQVTDALQDGIASVTSFIENIDLTKPMELFYYLTEIVKNFGKSGLSILKPLGEAFKEVFLEDLSIDVIISLAEKMENLTARFRLSEESSKNLKVGFKGIFDIVKLLIDGFGKLLKVFIPLETPIIRIDDGITGVIAALGSSMSAFSKWIRNSKKVKNAYDLLSGAVQMLYRWIGDLLTGIIKVGNKLANSGKIQAFINAIYGGIRKLWDFTKPIFTKIIDYISSFGSALISAIPDVAIMSFKSLSDVLENLGKLGTGIIGGFIETLGKLTTSSEELNLSNISDTFNNVGSSVEKVTAVVTNNKGIMSWIKNAGDFSKATLAAFSPDKGLNIETFMGSLSGFTDWIGGITKELASNFSSKGIFGNIAIGGMLYSFISFAKSFRDVSKTFSGIGKSVSQFLKPFTSLSNAINSYAKVLDAEALINVAKAIGILAASLVLLSFADPARLWGAAAVLSAVVYIIANCIGMLRNSFSQSKDLYTAINTLAVGLKKGLKNLTKGIKWKMIAMAIKDIGITLLMIVGAIVAFALAWSKNPEAMERATKVIFFIGSTLVGVMAVFSTSLGKFDKGTNSFLKSSGAIFVLALSISVIVGALSKLMKMEFSEDWISKFIVLIGIIAAMLGVFYVIDSSAIGGEDSSFKAGGTILALAAMLYISVKSLDKLMKMQFSDDWYWKLLTLGGIFVLMAGLIVVIGYAAKKSNGVLKAGGTILALTFMLIVVVGAMFVLTAIPSDKLGMSILAIAAIFLALAGVLAAASKIDKNNKAAESLKALSVMLFSIVGSLAILTLFKPEKLLKSITFLALTILAICGLFKSMGKAKIDQNAWKVLVAGAAMLISITASLAILSAFSWKKLLVSVLALSATMFAFAGMFKILSSSSDKFSVKDGIAYVIAASIVAIIGLALTVLATQKWDSILAASVGLAGAMLAIGFVFKMISEMKFDATAFGVVLAGVIMLGVIAAALYVLSSQPWENLLSSAASLVIALIGVSVALYVCKNIGGAVGDALIGIGAVILVIAVFGLLAWAVGEFLSDEAIGKMQKGIDAIVMIAEGCGRALAGIITGFAKQVIDLLPYIGTALSEFATNLEGFITAMEDMPDNTGQKAKDLASAIIALTVAEFIDGISNLFNLGNGLASLGTELSNFATNLGPFFEAVKDVKPESIQAASLLGDLMLKLTSADLISGIASFFGMGSKTPLSDFGEELKSLGPNLKAFAEEVVDVKPEHVEGAAAAVEIMSTVAKGLPTVGGLKGLIGGENLPLDAFGEELVSFGPNLVEFIKGNNEGYPGIEDVTEASVEGAARTTEILSTMAKGLPETSSLKTKIFGGENVSLSDFGEELAAFGPKLLEFALYAALVTPEAVSGAHEATSMMAELANNLPDKGGWWEDNTTLEDFGVQLATFGTHLKQYSDNIVDVDIKQLNNSISAVVQISDLMKDTNLSSAIEGAEGLSVALNELGTIGVNKFVEAFTDSDLRVTFAVIGMISFAIKAMANQDELFSNRGQAFMQQLINGISSKSDLVKTTVQLIALSISSALNGMYDSFKSAGDNAMKGYIDGLKGREQEAASIAKRIGDTTVSSIKKALDEHSPSRKTFNVADLAGVGFMQGLFPYISKAAQSGKDMGDSFIFGANSSISRISESINNDLSLDPVIRPVVDLNDVIHSADQISSMFNDAVKLNMANAEITANTMSLKGRGRFDGEIQNQRDSLGETNYNFYQYNTSPKALSRIDIYRQTNNQFSRFRKVVSNS